ncbi:peptide ABC transporter ATP-binding protein [Clostridia bacterium]|nr:peptide ABC transporter ATP-binding protein [Clostridia bacterium]
MEQTNNTPPQSPILKVENLSRHFVSGRGKKKTAVKAVDEISFQIEEGETFALVGESGCGKTTAARTIIRLYEPSGGTVRFDGADISGKLNKADRQRVTDGMQMIFQDPMSSLNPRMTVKDIVGEGLKVTRPDIGKEELLLRVNHALEAVGLTQEHASRYPHEFSGGQRQRIGIARAIITKPRLIIADEPVSALDVSIQAQVLNLLNNLKKEMGLTILFIAHNLSVVKYFSDRIAVMYQGKIVETGEVDQIYNNPNHPYTKSLLSAAPIPDPVSERKRQRIFYEG